MKAALSTIPATDLRTVRKFSKAKSIAARLGVCPRTIFRWADTGKIARHKTNARVVLFDEAEVAALIDSARVSFHRSASELQASRNQFDSAFC